MNKRSSMTQLEADTSWVPRIVSGGFWSASTAFTGTGIYFSAQLAINSPVISTIFAATATGMVTFTGYSLFQNGGMQLGKQEKPARDLAGHVNIDVTPKMRKRSLLAGLGIMLISSWFSFSSMVFLNFGDDLQQAMNEEIQAPLIAPIRTLEIGLVEIERDAAALAGLARERSALEEASGGQCRRSPPGDGPITRMIADHAAQTTTIARSASELRERASVARASIQQAKNQLDVDAAYALAEGVLNDPARTTILDDAHALQRGYSGAGFLSEGQRITCPVGAPLMLPVLDELVSSAEADIFLPSEAPNFRQATLIDSAMWQLRSVATLGKESIPGISSWYLLLFGIFALMLDSLGALTAHMAGRKRGARLSEQEWADLEDHHAAMEDFIWATPGAYIKNRSGNVIDYDPSIIMVMPTEAADKVSKDLIEVLQGFTAAYGLVHDATRAARSLSDLPFDYQHLKRRMQRRGFNGDLFDIYRGDPSDWELIFEHQRILRLLVSQGAKMPKHRYKIKSKPNNVTPLRAKI